MANNFKMIATGLYGPKAELALKSVFMSMATGYLHVSNPGQWHRYAKIEVQPDGEAAIMANVTTLSSGFYCMSDVEVKKKIAKWLKALVKRSIGDSNLAKWDRLCNVPYITADSVPVAVSEAYLCYETLLERNVRISKYCHATVQSIIGKKKSSSEIAADKRLNDMKIRHEAEIRALLAKHQAELMQFKIDHESDKA